MLWGKGAEAWIFSLNPTISAAENKSELPLSFITRKFLFHIVPNHPILGFFYRSLINRIPSTGHRCLGFFTGAHVSRLFKE